MTSRAVASATKCAAVGLKRASYKMPSCSDRGLRTRLDWPRTPAAQGSGAKTGVVDHGTARHNARSGVLTLFRNVHSILGTCVACRRRRRCVAGHALSSRSRRSVTLTWTRPEVSDAAGSIYSGHILVHVSAPLSLFPPPPPALDPRRDQQGVLGYPSRPACARIASHLPSSERRLLAISSVSVVRSSQDKYIIVAAMAVSVSSLVAAMPASILDSFLTASTSTFLLAALSTFLVYFAASVVHQLFFSPLAGLPGPWYAAISDFWLTTHVVRMQQCRIVQDLFERYGPVVRVGPNKVVFCNASTMRSVYCVHKFDKSTYYKSLLTSVTLS